MEDGKGSDVVLGRKIGVEVGQEIAGTHRLVDDDLRGERGDVAFDVAALVVTLKLLAREVEAALHVYGLVGGVDDKGLADLRHRAEGDLAEAGRLDGHVTPLDGKVQAL